MINKFDHSLLFIILLAQIPHTYYFHEYYEPLFLIILFTLFDKSLTKNFLKNSYNLKILYLFYIFYYLATLIKNYKIFNLDFNV